MRKFSKTMLFAVMLMFGISVAAQQWDWEMYRRIESEIQLPRMADSTSNVYPVIDIRTCGAKSTISARHNQKAIQKAIDHCSRRGGGRVVVPKGQTFQTGAIELKSNVELHIEEAAKLSFTFEPQLYPIVETSWEGMDCFNLSPCI